MPIFGNRNRPAMTGGQRAAVGAGSYLGGPIIGALMRTYINQRNAAADVLGRGGAVGYATPWGRNGSSQAPDNQAQPQAPADTSSPAVTDLPGAAGSALAGATAQPVNAQGRTPEQEAMYRAMLDFQSQVSAANYGQDIGFVNPSARAPRER